LVYKQMEKEREEVEKFSFHPQINTAYDENYNK
jgi:hypothetical protein